MTSFILFAVSLILAFAAGVFVAEELRIGPAASFGVFFLTFGTSLIVLFNVKNRFFPENVPTFMDKRVSLIQESYKKFRYHVANSRVSLSILLSITAIAIFIIVFAQYIVVLDRAFTVRTVGADFSGFSFARISPCDMLIDREVRTLPERQQMVEAFQNCIERVQQAETQIRGETQSRGLEQDEQPRQDLFWPVLLLRVSVLAFSFFIIYFFIRNYQYDVAMANRYFSIFASMLADERLARSVKEFAEDFDARDVKFGTLKTSPVEDVVRFPKEILDLIRSDRSGPAEPKERRRIPAPNPGE